MREPSLKEIQATLKYIKENFTVEDKSFEQVLNYFCSFSPKCYECSSTMQMFCQSKPENCSGPHTDY